MQRRPPPDPRSAARRQLLAAAACAALALGALGLVANGAALLRERRAAAAAAAAASAAPAAELPLPNPTGPPSPAPAADASAASSDSAASAPGAGGAASADAAASGAAAATGSSLQTAVRCTGNNLTLPAKHWGNHIINRSCVYTDLVLRGGKWLWVGAPPPDGFPEVSLASKPILVGKKSFPKQYPAQWADLQSQFRWRPRQGPEQAEGPPPRRLEGLTVFYTPEVAPWNYAHTLFNDLFALFWGMDEHGDTSLDARVVVAGALYNQAFQKDRHRWLPGNNAIKSFSRRAPLWDADLVAQCAGAGCVLSRMLVGAGTRSWAQVTEGFAAPGGTGLWLRFRAHVLSVLSIAPPAPSSRQRFIICNKKADSSDTKRGIVNAAQVAQWVSERWPEIDGQALLLSSLPVREQTQLMANARYYMCNEGTLGTAFFLLPPGSAWLSVMNVFRRNTTYDLYRPYSQRHLFWNTGGNIDWFAVAARWVKALHYDRYELGDVVMDPTAGNFRNYLPNWSIRINRKRFERLMQRAVEFVNSGRAESDGDNLSVMGRICAAYMRKMPGFRRLFTSTKCAYGMSWLCEWISNSNASLRRGHPKWKQGCGNWPSPQQLGIVDPRDEWLAEEGFPEEPRGTTCVRAGEGLPFPCKDKGMGGHRCCT